MYPIRYYYSSLSKQFFLISLIIAIGVSFGLFFAGGFYKEAYVLPSVLLYVAGLLLCAFLLVAYKFTASQFDHEKITYTDRILKKEKTIFYSQIQSARFTRKNIVLNGGAARENTTQENTAQESAVQNTLLIIPLRRFGAISPVGVDNFMTMLKNNGIPVEKEYEVLPGYGSASKWAARGFLFLGALILLNFAPYIALLYWILTDSH